jgi:hypothetical protein
MFHVKHCNWEISVHEMVIEFGHLSVCEGREKLDLNVSRETSVHELTTIDKNGLTRDVRGGG